MAVSLVRCAAVERLEEGGHVLGVGEEAEGPGAVAVEMAEHLETQIESDDAVGHVAGGRTEPAASPIVVVMARSAKANHGPMRAATSAPEPRRGRGAGDHLDQDGDIAGVEILPEDGGRHVDQFGR